MDLLTAKHTGPLTKWIYSLPNTHHHTYTPHETNTTTKNIDSNRSVNTTTHIIVVVSVNMSYKSGPLTT